MSITATEAAVKSAHMITKHNNHSTFIHILSLLHKQSETKLEVNVSLVKLQVYRWLSYAFDLDKIIYCFQRVGWPSQLLYDKNFTFFNSIKENIGCSMLIVFGRYFVMSYDKNNFAAKDQKRKEMLFDLPCLYLLWLHDLFWVISWKTLNDLTTNSENVPAHKIPNWCIQTTLTHNQAQKELEYQFTCSGLST